jgi:hypothetical protein
MLPSIYKLKKRRPVLSGPEAPLHQQLRLQCVCQQKGR